MSTEPAYLPALTHNYNRSELELPNMHNYFRRSELELRGPSNGLNIDPWPSGRVCSVPLFALVPNMTTNGDVLE
eukprot:14747841-Alexandrium_andersonii.AAC.1